MCFFFSFTFFSFLIFISEKPAAFGARDKNDTIQLIPVVWGLIKDSKPAIVFNLLKSSN